MMHRRSCLSMMLGTLLPAPALAAEAAPETDVNADLDAIRTQFGLPALAAAVTRGGSIVAAGATGVRVRGGDIKVTIDDRFHLGSDGKAMTATLAGMMVEEKKLDWTSTIGGVLGDTVPGINSEVAVLRLENLLSHSSGLPSDNEEMLNIYFTADVLKYNLVDLRLLTFVKLKDRPPISPVGAAFHYSNFAYMIAGMMVEKAAKSSWEQLITDRIFTPLGLKTAGLGPQATMGRLDAAIGHDIEGETITPMPWGPAADGPPMLAPAGIAHMSVLDFATWAAWNAGAGKRGPALVKPETLARIHHPMIDTGRIPNPRPGTPQEGQYALGWGIVKYDWAPGPVLTHNGSNGFNLAKIVVDTDRDISLVAVTNIAGPKAEDATNVVVEKLYRRFGA
jgi:CubicO group peptidase (beta-lactamase class C family)